jgi:hypothetical protein
LRFVGFAALALSVGVIGLAPAADRASAGIVGWISDTIRAEGEIALERVKNPSGLPGATAEDASFRIALSYRLGSGE